MLLTSVFISYAISVSVNRANEFKVSFDSPTSFNPQIITDFILTNNAEKEAVYSSFPRKIQISNINFDILQIGNFTKTLFDSNDQQIFTSSSFLLSLFCILRI
jgi:hypothetical protein